MNIEKEEWGEDITGKLARLRISHLFNMGNIYIYWCKSKEAKIETETKSAHNIGEKLWNNKTADWTEEAEGAWRAKGEYNAQT